MLWSESILEGASHYQVPSGYVLYGQKRAKEQVLPIIRRCELVPDVFIKGPPGMGKTHFAHWLAQRLNMPIEPHMCPIGYQEFGYNHLILLDEIHLLSKPEWVFKQMGLGGRVFVGATTKPEKVDDALRSRFYTHITLEPYSAEDLAEMIDDHYDGPQKTTMILAKAAAGNPRQAMRLVTVANKLGSDNAEEILRSARVTVDGITDDHIRYMRILYKMSRPIGLEQLEILLYENKYFIQEAERHLLDVGLISLTAGGRVLTTLGKAYVERRGDN